MSNHAERGQTKSKIPNPKREELSYFYHLDFDIWYFSHVDKQKTLEDIAARICNNTNSPLHGSSRCVPGEGNPEAQIFFAGEAPGYHEAQQGRPFVGPAGQLLEKALVSIGFKREEVFIGNVIHFRPPENRDPTPEEVETEKPFLLEQIEVVDPKIIATLGRFAMQIFLPRAKISKDHGLAQIWRGKIVFPLYHPAAALRSGAVMQDFMDDFQKLKEIYEKLSRAKIDEVAGKPEEKKSAEQLSLFS